jgi:hypothetical protein
MLMPLRSQSPVHKLACLIAAMLASLSVQTFAADSQCVGTVSKGAAWNFE